jgi:hypothetical protein
VIAAERRPRLDDERLARFNQSADLSTYPRKISVRTTRRMKLMGDKHPRHKAALQLAVEQSG